MAKRPSKFRFGVSAKLTAAFTIFTAAVVLAGLGSIFYIEKLGNLFNSVYNDNFVALNDVKNAKVSTQYMMIETYRYLGTQDPDQLGKIEIKLENESAKLKGLFDGPFAGYSEARALLAQSEEVRMEAMGHHYNFNTQIAFELINTKGQDLFQRLSKILDDISVHEDEIAQDRVQAGLEIKEGIIVYLVTVIVIRILLNSTIAYLIYKAVTKPLYELVRYITNLSATSNFSSRINVSRKDEMGDASRAMNKLTSSLSEIISDIGKTLKDYSKGNYSKRIEADLVGDLLELKNSINETGRQTEETIKSINSIMVKVANNDFGKRIDLDLQGDLAQLCGNINSTIDILERSFQSLNEEVEVRTRAERKLREKTQELIDVSRDIGRAEIASSTLHNVGNSLNSLGVAVHAINSSLPKMDTGEMDELVKLMSNDDSLVNSMLSDKEKRTKLLAFLENSVEVQREVTNELSSLSKRISKHVEHMKRIISFQQELGRTKVLESRINISELIRTSIDISGYQNDDVEIVMNHLTDTIYGDKDVLIQILVNLISNAKHAIVEKAGEKRIKITVNETKENLIISVEDWGIGMTSATENNIFKQGFTTKQNGNGIGLHHSHLIAKNIGAKLSFENKGLNNGAIFSVSVPTRKTDRNVA
ncbi:MAG: ATP-binding protein [Gammaproteobacteria bacterium]|nr:ATP-binding protein [Gammaproteobacteria bacterium]